MNVSFRRAKSTDKVVDLKTFNDMQIWLERVANMTTDQYFNLSKGDPNYMLFSRTGVSSTSTTSYSDWAFGFSISGAVVTVNTGDIWHGTRVAFAAMATDITITADQTWIYVEYVIGNNSALIKSKLTKPLITPTVIEYPLHLWKVLNGVVNVDRILHLGDIIIPGVFA
jgi:hypothetical protein